ncbi:hypothetical protein OG905_08770 [Streptomyces sp. NBC_00322]|uniref:hypothetical protein n=1 Tax=Streptomyces sp. NBC_00322 TaxID=2975712 RepID=UPI002E2A04B7|nr:hypothetical protein [Streptomyces sp. NBC_00322]
MLRVPAGLAVAVPLAARAAPALLQIYPVWSVHQASPDNRLTINGKRMPVMDHPGYDPQLADVHVRVPEGVVNDWMPSAGTNDVP